MPPIHPDWLASSDQSAAISFRLAAKVMSAARFATKPKDSKMTARLDPPRVSLASSNARTSAPIVHLMARDHLPSQ